MDDYKDNQHKSENVLAPPNPTSSIKHDKSIICKDAYIKWSLFIGVTWINLGIGYNWLSQTAIKKQTEAYYHNEYKGYYYRVLGETWLITLLLLGFFITWIAKRFFVANNILAA